MRSDDDWVSQVITIIGRAQQIVARGSETFFDADNDVELLAGRMAVIDVDAAADNLSAEFRAAHAEVPWRALARARDKYAHHYEDIDRGVVWTLLVKELPDVAEALRRS